MDRRRFVEALGGTLATLPFAPLGAACASDSSAAADVTGQTSRPVGVQLYTVRSEMERDFEGTLARVAEIGYREVEFAGYFDRSPREVRRALDDAGLVAPAAHVQLDPTGDDWPSVLEAANVVGHQYVVVPWIPEEQRTLSGYQRIAERFQRAGEQARRAGIRFGYHNHDFEFEPVDDLIPYDILLDQTDPSAVEFELDLYWIEKAGADSFAYFERWPGRFPLVHVKDMDETPEQGMTEVGSGTIDFAKVVGSAEQAGIRHWFVEHDHAASPFDSIRESYEAMTQLLPA